MDYRPRYQQPFTLEEARQLPVPLITEGAPHSREPPSPHTHLAKKPRNSPMRTRIIHYTTEIARLQNSVTHLRRTQDELQDALAEAPGDPDLEQAFGENEVVMCARHHTCQVVRAAATARGTGPPSFVAASR